MDFFQPTQNKSTLVIIAKHFGTDYYLGLFWIILFFRYCGSYTSLALFVSVLNSVNQVKSNLKPGCYDKKLPFNFSQTEDKISNKFNNLIYTLLEDIIYK